MAEFKATLNLFDYYYAQLRKNLFARISSLRGVLRSLESGSHKDLSRSHPDSFPTVEFPVEIDANSQAEIELSSAFADLIDSFINFIDEIISVTEINRKASVRVPRKLIGNEILEFIIEHVQSEAKKIASDASLSNPAKLNRFELSDFSKNASLGYFDIRNGIRHHRRIAKKDMILLYHALDLTIEGHNKKTRSILGPGERVEEGEKIWVGFKIHEHPIQKDEKIKLEERELEGIILSIEKVITPEIVKAASKMYKKL